MSISLRAKAVRFTSVVVLVAVSILLAFDSPQVQAQTPTVATGGRGCTSGTGFGLSAADSNLIGELQRSAGNKAIISCHGTTGKVRFVGTPAGQPVPAPAGLPANATAEQSARAFLGKYGSIFGIQNQSTELRVMKNLTDTPDKTFIRFQQVYQGIPVLGGEIISQVDQNNQIVSTGGELSPTPAIAVAPRIKPATAQATALNTLARENHLSAKDFTATAPELWIYDSRLLENSNRYPHALVWRLEVSTSNTKEPLRELVLVDAQNGKILLHFNQIADAKQRLVCNVNNVRGNQQDCTAAQAVRTEGSPATGNTDVDLAYQFAGITYDFYFNNFNRDSLNGQGLPLKSTVKYCPATSNDGGCPLLNAFWNGTQMYYGDSFASADDVVGHELTHGFTQYTSGLFYYYQSGALNESMSDVFGELVDLTDNTDGYAGNGANVRWLIGEDLPAGVFFPGAPNGALRSMKDPTIYNNPDRITNSNYYGGYQDNGGVHTNSGVNNKAAYLMADGTINEPGGSFNGQTIAGLGLTKTAHIYYELETHLLTSASDYQDVYDYLQQACRNLIGTNGITASDCQQVKKVVDATEMNLTPPAAPTVKAPICDAGKTPQYTVNYNLENPASGNWATQTGSGTNEWFYPGSNNPYGVGPYATSGVNNFWGNDQATPADYSIGMTHSVVVPQNGYLHFNHAFDFEWDFFSTGYDGGVVEYSTNDGATWQDAGPLFIDNSGYTVTLNSSTNPLNGRDAFSGVSNGYGSSRLDLSSLAGQSVRFRFRIGTDDSNSSADGSGDILYGWFIDDIAIYACNTPGATTTTSLTAPTPNSPAGQTVVFQVQVTASNGSTPTGQVTFKDGAITLGTTNLSNTGVTSYSTSTLSAGSHTITALYLGANGFNPSTSNSVTEVITPAGCSNAYVVTNGADDGSCGSFRLAVGLVNNNTGVGAPKTVDLSGLAPGSTITLNSSINIGPGVIVTTKRACSANGPDITIKPAAGVNGDGLILNGVKLSGVWVRQFNGRQIVANGKGNVLSCVRTTRN